MGFIVFFLIRFSYYYGRVGGKIIRFRSSERLKKNVLGKIILLYNKFIKVVIICIRFSYKMKLVKMLVRMGDFIFILERLVIVVVKSFFRVVVVERLFML